MSQIDTLSISIWATLEKKTKFTLFVTQIVTQIETLFLDLAQAEEENGQVGAIF